MTNTNKRRSNGEGTLYQDKKGLWHYQLSYTSLNGTTKRKSFYGKTKTEVRKKGEEFKKNLILGNLTTNANCTIGDLLKENADYMRDTYNINESSYTRRVYTVGVIEDSFIGKIPITKITVEDIKKFLNDISQKYSNSIISKEYSGISLAFRIAIDKKILSYNLMDSPLIIKPKSFKPTKVVKGFTCEEEKIFLNALDDKIYKANSIDYVPIFKVLINSGCRCGEVCALSLEDIDFKEKVVHIKRTTTRDKNYKTVMGDTTKTPRGVRDIPMNNHLEEILREAVDNYTENPYKVLFYDYQNNKLISTSQVNSAFQRLCKDIGIKTDGGQHRLRHTFATRCIEAGIEADILRDWLGHTDIRITLDTYSDVFAKRHNKAVKQYSEYFSKNIQ